MALQSQCIYYIVLSIDHLFFKATLEALRLIGIHSTQLNVFLRTPIAGCSRSLYSCCIRCESVPLASREHCISQHAQG